MKAESTFLSFTLLIGLMQILISLSWQIPLWTRFVFGPEPAINIAKEEGDTHFMKTVSIILYLQTERNRWEYKRSFALCFSSDIFLPRCAQSVIRFDITTFEFHVTIAMWNVWFVLICASNYVCEYFLSLGRRQNKLKPHTRSALRALEFMQYLEMILAMGKDDHYLLYF